MASPEETDQAGADYTDPLWSVNQAGLKMPRPAILTKRKDIGKKYEERLERFRESCSYLQALTKVERRPNYSKEFLQRLEEAAESFHDLRGPMLARYPMEVSHAFRREQAEIVHELGMVPVFTKHAKELLNEKLESKNERKVLEWCMYLLMNNCFNSLDVAHNLAKDKDYLRAAHKFLSDTPSKPEKFRHTITRWTLKQIINMSRVPANSRLLRDANIHRVLLTYTKTTDPEFCLAALSTLAHIEEGKLVNPDQSSKSSEEKIEFKLPDDSVDTLLSKIKEAWKSSTKSSTGWPFRELLEVVGSLAKNEDNRRVLVARGCLSPLTHLVSSEVLQDEIAALRTLWRLSMCDENRKKMMEHEDLIDLIKNKFNSSNDERVKGLAYGVLRCLKNELKKSPRHQDVVKKMDLREEEAKMKSAEKIFAVSGGKNLEGEMKRLNISSESQALVPKREERHNIRAEGNGMQVMLSYNRMHREKVKEICMFLLENGFKVWFDMNNMTTDALDAMAGAIETSDVICICYSRGYYESQYCEMEAKYTVAKNKRKVFIKMEDYSPCGWLGIMMGTAFYVDYTGRKEYTMMRDLLIDELLQRRKEGQAQPKMIEHKPIQEKGDEPDPEKKRSDDPRAAPKNH